MFEQFKMVILYILGLWIAFVFIIIFIKRNIIGFLLIGLSIIIMFIPSTHYKWLILAISNFPFITGAILLGTIERDKVRLLGVETTLLDRALGRIPSIDKYRAAPRFQYRELLIIASSSLLVVASLIYFFVYHTALSIVLPMFVIGVVLGLYSLTRM